MAEPLKELTSDELESAFAEREKENEELKERVKELEEENSMYVTEIRKLNLNTEELEDRIHCLQLQNTCNEIHICLMTQNDKRNKEYIEKLKNGLIQLEHDNKIYIDYIRRLENENEKYKIMMKDICLKPSNLGKIPTYTILRKDKYPYFIIRSTNYDEALEESKKCYPNLKEVYKVNYDHEETYSNNRLVREFNHIDILDKEMLLVNYTEQKFVEDLKNFSMTHQNGCHTFGLIKKEEYPYYAYKVQKENYIQTKIKYGKRFPHAEVICTLFDIPNAVMLHNRIKEKFSKHLSGNNIKLPDNYTEEEFIREVERMAKPPSLSP